MQHKDMVLISTVIPLMEQLIEVILDFAQDELKHPAVRSAALRGIEILKKYYCLVDSSWVYRIAIGVYIPYLLLTMPSPAI
jgi:hypothetical protein